MAVVVGLVGGALMAMAPGGVAARRAVVPGGPVDATGLPRKSAEF